MASIYQRKKSWWISYYIDGKRIFQSLRTRDKKVAEHLRKKKELEIEEKRSPIPQKSISIEESMQRYLQTTAVYKAQSTLCKDTLTLKYFNNAIKVKNIQNLSSSIIETYLHNRLLSRKSVNTINGELGIIKKWLNWEIQKKTLFENPCSSLKNLKKPQNPIVFLSKEEIEKLLKIARNSHLYSMIATALYAGLRVGELIHLEWTDINFEKDIITVQNKHEWNIKSKKFRVIPLNQKLKKILHQAKNKSPYCFLTPRGNPYTEQPKRSFHTIRKKIVITKKIGWHILRKTFGSQLAIQGVSLLKIQKWLGHSDPRVTIQHYAHLSPDFDQDINKI